MLPLRTSLPECVGWSKQNCETCAAFPERVDSRAICHPCQHAQDSVLLLFKAFGVPIDSDWKHTKSPGKSKTLRTRDHIVCHPQEVVCNDCAHGALRAHMSHACVHIRAVQPCVNRNRRRIRCLVPAGCHSSKQTPEKHARIAIPGGMRRSGTVIAKQLEQAAPCRSSNWPPT